MMEQDPILSELMRTLTRERIQGQTEICTLKPDFYKVVIDKLSSIVQIGYSRWHSTPLGMYRQLVMIRRSKILRMAEQTAIPPDWSTKLTDEEKEFYNAIHKAVLKLQDDTKI